MVEEVIVQYNDDSFMTAALAVANRMNVAINPAAFYLDENHCVPHIFKSNKLLVKMKLMRDFLQAINTISLDPMVISPMTSVLVQKFVEGQSDRQSSLSGFSGLMMRPVFALMPERRRLPELTRRIEAYERSQISTLMPALLDNSFLKPKQEEASSQSADLDSSSTHNP